MNSLFQNVRGITAPGRKSLIIDTLWKVHPSIVGFQETKKENFNDSFLRALVSGRNCS